MAGILVSGGTYSGSGDVTTDWFYCPSITDTISTAYMPDNMYITGFGTEGIAPGRAFF